MMANYGTPQIALARGEGRAVWDVEGREYLDLVAGIAVSSLGHAHPAVVEAVTRQASTLAHTSNLYLHEPEIALAERLLELLGVDGEGLLLSGRRQANEAALKIARRIGTAARSRADARRESSRSTAPSTAARSARCPSPARRPSASRSSPCPVRFGSSPTATSTRSRRPSDRHRGRVPRADPGRGRRRACPRRATSRRSRGICDRTGALLVVDEVQSGIGRTGCWFTCRAQGVTPDVVTLAKGLAGGFPIGACMATGDVADAFRPGDHGTTFGGNPVACAAALAVLDTIERDDLLAHVREVGRRCGPTASRTLPSAASSSGRRGRRASGRRSCSPTARRPAVEAAARQRVPR